jgi:hypothetical protein
LTGEAKAAKDHSTLREKLQSKDYIIVDEFQCKGFNTNSFMKYFGGMNKVDLMLKTSNMRKSLL